MSAKFGVDRSAVMAPKLGEYISINPNKELNFISSKSKFTSSVTLTNLLFDSTVIFRVRVTDSSSYVVRPTAGIILPKEKRTITIFFTSKSSIHERFEDKFLIQAFHYNGEDIADEPNHVQDAFQLFSDSSKSFQNLKLKVHFEINSGLDESTSAEEYSPKGRSNFSPDKELAHLDEIASPARVKSVANFSPVATLSPKKLRPLINDRNTYQETLENIPKSTSSPLHYRKGTIDEPQEVNLFATEFKRKSYMNHIMLASRRRTIQLSLAASPINLKKENSISPKNQKAEFNTEESENDNNSCLSQAKQAQMYEKKFDQLKKKFKQQNALLAKISSERNDFLNQLNKLKFTFSTEGHVQEGGEVKLYQRRKFELWQLLIVSIFFLIVGSFLKVK